MSRDANIGKSADDARCVLSEFRVRSIGGMDQKDGPMTGRSVQARQRAKVVAVVATSV
jgi:hypothetical protein